MKGKMRFAFALVLVAFFAAVGDTADKGVFSLKDGRVYKGKTAIDCEVNKVPDFIEGPIRYWSALGPDTSDAVKEDETGVWFFSGKGKSLTFVPLESEHECQGVTFSPDGGRFVLTRGSGVRPDIFYEVYGEGAEKLAEFDGFRSAAEWINPVRFVFTRLDDIRDSEQFVGPVLFYGVKLSVVMYDAAAKEAFVLKESTDKQNYRFFGVTGDGSALTVGEESVKSEKDWGDEDKIETREIEVEIPAAG